MVGAGDASRNHVIIPHNRERNSNSEVSMEKIYNQVLNLTTVTNGKVSIDDSNLHNVQNKIIRFLYYKDTMK